MSNGRVAEARRHEPPLRTASGTPRVPALDGFRAYAILGVVSVHLMGASGVLAKSDGTSEGVVLWSIFGNSIDTFFIVSGFVLFLPAVVRRGDIGSKLTFWIGRGARLLPAYWLVIAITLLLVALVPPTWAVAGYSFPSLANIAAHLAGMQMPALLFDSNFALGFGVMQPVWLISIVVSFYLLLPFVARAYYRHPLIGLGVAAAITVVWKQAIAWTPGVFEALSDGTEPFVRLIAVDQFPGWAFSFGLGMTGAWAYIWARSRYSTAQLTRASLLAVPAVLLLYAYGAYLFGSTAWTTSGNIGPAARSQSLETMLSSFSRTAVIGVVVLGPVWIRWPFVNRATARLAELSYGVYLIHWLLVIYAIDLLDLPRNGSLVGLAVWLAVILPPSLIFAALSRRFLELPIQRWVRRRTTTLPLDRSRPDDARGGPDRQPSHSMT